GRSQCRRGCHRRPGRPWRSTRPPSRMTRGRTSRPGRGGEPVPDLSYPSEDAPVFVISVAAELSGMHPQTLRQYDRLGLVSPGRSPGGGRRYSARDVALLRAVSRLSAEGVSLAGIKRIVDLESVVAELTDEIDRLNRQVADLMDQLRVAQHRPSLLPAVRWYAGDGFGTPAPGSAGGFATPAAWSGPERRPGSERPPGPEHHETRSDARTADDLGEGSR